VPDVEENHELVSADASEGIRLAHSAAHLLGDLEEQAIARLVPERIVHRLEAVDVEQQQRDLTLAPRRGREHLHQPVAEVRPVRKLGELVLPREA